MLFTYVHLPATSRRIAVFLVIFGLLALLPVMPISAQTCSGAFIEHLLPHTTQSRGSTVRFYESNGSGLAINDLNGDGLLDLVLGNLDGSNRILWNEGDLTFRAQEFPRPTGRTRAVQTIDVDADGWLDIIFTSQVGAPQWWRSNGDETFTLTPLGNVLRPAYTVAWVDADRDGDLDLVTASYDAELLQLLRDSFLNSGGAGVIYYENTGDGYESTRLAEQAQALALAVSDVNGDGLLDLVVGNDFSLPDQSWSFVDGAWRPAELFATTTFSTMSFDLGDINNDGVFEFFAADMHPVDETPDSEAAWRYVTSDLNARQVLPGDTQASRNMFYGPEQTADQGLIDQAADYGIAATGWTWSSKFGDLDQDGYLDLYLVNGMASVELFGHLPDDELIEPNYAFRNDAGARFVPAPEWGLGSLSGGRGMSMGDLDNDGDLDIVVNNLNAPAQVFENQLCSGASLQVELRAPGTPNLFGLGARLVLNTSSGTYTRELQAVSGYLSGDPVRAHFGFPIGTQLEQLNIMWSDGVVTIVTDFGSDPFLIISRKAAKPA
ncbi:MAG: CRTAC1 family protein [Chloroflexi bacterium]|uniref:CRTAC1 family protein n=1 Tax=Candidatus Flexifilum breve TaxID=3140694 RepID=UPI0031365710|nr:CRTAC1 family protein [Chloroflexota bacterium]